jgi:hypothetical protein
MSCLIGTEESFRGDCLDFACSELVILRRISSLPASQCCDMCEGKPSPNPNCA